MKQILLTLSVVAFSCGYTTGQDFVITPEAQKAMDDLERRHSKSLVVRTPGSDSTVYTISHNNGDEKVTYVLGQYTLTIIPKKYWTKTLLFDGKKRVKKGKLTVSSIFSSTGLKEYSAAEVTYQRNYVMIIVWDDEKDLRPYHGAPEWRRAMELTMITHRKSY